MKNTLTLFLLAAFLLTGCWNDRDDHYQVWVEEWYTVTEEISTGLYRGYIWLHLSGETDAAALSVMTYEGGVEREFFVPLHGNEFSIDLVIYSVYDAGGIPPRTYSTELCFYTGTERRREYLQSPSLSFSSP
jgi:hypothetical protein